MCTILHQRGRGLAEAQRPLQPVRPDFVIIMVACFACPTTSVANCILVGVTQRRDCATGKVTALGLLRLNLLCGISNQHPNGREVQ